MKKEYKNPTTEIVVLNLGEQLTADDWGAGAKLSNDGAYTEAKENPFDEVEEDEDGTDGIRYTEFKSIWENEKKYIE